MKNKKAPGIFKKPVRKDKWEKIYLKKIYLPDDRKFLQSLEVEEDGFVGIDISGLSAKDLKRLKALGKVIKKNRKQLNFILIFILVLLVGGGLLFNFYFKNRLVQRLVETQLEGIFNARVDTGGVNFSVMKGNFSLSRLAIADAQHPMKNLVEFSSVSADLSTAELLQGRVFIREIGFSGMKRGTDRAISGMLPDKPDGEVSEVETSPGAEGKETGKDTINNVINQVSALAGNIDVGKILEQQKNNLASFEAIEQSKAKIEEYSGYWQGRIESWDGRLDEWETSVNYMASVNTGSFSSIESAQSTISKLQSIYNDADRDFNEVRNDYNAAEQNYREASGMTRQIQSAIKTDYDYIETLVTLPAGDKVKWASSILEEQLSMPVSKYLSYLERGLEWYNRFKRFKDSREAKKPDARRISRKLPAPADAPPVFTLVHAFADGEETDLKYMFDLNNLASDPEKWKEKASLDINIDTPSTGAASAVITEDSISLQVPSAPFDLGNSLGALDIASFTGRLAFDSKTSWDNAEFRGNLNLTADDLVITESTVNSIVYRLVSTAFDSVNPMAAEGFFTYSRQSGLDLSLETELDESLGRAARELVSKGAEEGLGRLRAYLDEQLAGSLSEFESVRDELEGYADQVKGYEAKLDEYRKMAEDKISGIEKSVQDNIKKQAESVIKDTVPEEVIKEGTDALKSLGSKLKF